MKAETRVLSTHMITALLMTKWKHTLRGRWINKMQCAWNGITQSSKGKKLKYMGASLNDS